MAKFEFPTINPFSVPQNIGADGIHSRYLFNNYRQEWTPSTWRRAIDRAIQYSDLTYLDALYSWCIQASPFLMSQINKRLIPLYKRSIVFGSGVKENRSLTDKHIRGSFWFNRLLRYACLSQFYGVKCFAIDPEKREVADFPLRNLDIFNKGLRYMTYDYYEVVPASKYDNMFFFEPETDQDFRLGLLQSISRAMIGIVEVFTNWQILGKRYSFPMTTIGYDANNPEAKKAARMVAENLDMLTIPLIPKTVDAFSAGGKTSYSVEVNPIPTQTTADAFRVFKEYIIEYRSEIMQLVTGGTLLGATEKNTNSEQLAEIHWNIYEDILNRDASVVLDMLNSDEVRHKLAVIFDDYNIERSRFIEIPDKTISTSKFVDIGDMMARQKLRFSKEAFRRVGLDPEDIEKDQPENTGEKPGLLSRVLGRNKNKGKDENVE